MSAVGLSHGERIKLEVAAVALRNWQLDNVYYQVFNSPEACPTRGKSPVTVVVVGTHAHPLPNEIRAEGDDAMEAIGNAYRQYLEVK